MVSGSRKKAGNSVGIQGVGCKEKDFFFLFFFLFVCLFIK